MTSSLRSRSFAFALLVAWLLSGCADHSELALVARHLTAIESGEPFLVPNSELTDQRGEPYNLRSHTRGRFGLLFFGYTHCPDVCPISVATITEALSRLREDERGRVVALFVSVDFARDDPARLTNWLQQMRSPAVGLTGTRAELEEVLSPMRVRVPSRVERRVVEGLEPGGYLVPHPSSIFLITPDGVVRFLYAFGRASPDEIVQDLRVLMELDW